MIELAMIGLHFEVKKKKRWDLEVNVGCGITSTRGYWIGCVRFQANVFLNISYTTLVKRSPNCPVYGMVHGRTHLFHLHATRLTLTIIAAANLYRLLVDGREHSFWHFDHAECHRQCAVGVVTRERRHAAHHHVRVPDRLHLQRDAAIRPYFDRHT